MKKATNKKKGFSLVELIVVITILAILSVIGMQAVGPIIAKSKAQTDMSNGETIGNSIARVYAEGDTTSIPYTAAITELAGSAAATTLTSKNILNPIPAIKTNTGYTWSYELSADGVVKVYIGNATAGRVQCYPKDMTATNLDKLPEFKNLK